MNRSKQAQQVEYGLQVNGWTVTSEIPTRGAKGLMWTISCTNNHEVQVEHSRLSYGVVPIQCAECIQQAASQRANEKAEERRLEAEFRNMQQLARKEAQQERIGA